MPTNVARVSLTELLRMLGKHKDEVKVGVLTRGGGIGVSGDVGFVVW